MKSIYVGNLVFWIAYFITGLANGPIGSLINLIPFGIGTILIIGSFLFLLAPILLIPGVGNLILSTSSKNNSTKKKSSNMLNVTASGKNCYACDYWSGSREYTRGQNMVNYDTSSAGLCQAPGQIEKRMRGPFKGSDSCHYSQYFKKWRMLK